MLKVELNEDLAVVPPANITFPLYFLFDFISLNGSPASLKISVNKLAEVGEAVRLKIFPMVYPLTVDVLVELL